MAVAAGEPAGEAGAGESGKWFAAAKEAGLLALEWIARGHGYEITGADAWAAYAATMKAAAAGGGEGAARERVRAIAAGESVGSRFLGAALGRDIEMPDR